MLGTDVDRRDEHQDEDDGDEEDRDRGREQPDGLITLVRHDLNRTLRA